MPDPTIRVTVERVIFTPTGRAVGTGRGSFQARVITGAGTTNLGNSAQVFNYRTTPSIQLNWSADINVRNQDHVTFTLSASDDAATALGSFRYRLNRPYREFEHEILSTDNLHVVWSVEQRVRRGARRWGPWIFTAREHSGSVRYTSLYGRREFRLEVCPVRPVPDDTRLPRRPWSIQIDQLLGPGRPVRNGSAKLVGAGDPMNVIPNPPIIPRLGPPPAEAPATPPTNAQLDVATTANERNCARIEFTYYFPNTERFTDNDTRLEWRKTGGTGNVAFLRAAGAPRNSENKGLKVLVYGTADGEVELGVYFRSALVAKYRAIVAQVKHIPCRFNILNGPPGPPPDRFRSTPISTPAHVVAHREIANRFLCQMGLILVPDTDRRVLHTSGRAISRVDDHPGVFRVRANDGDTRGVSDARCERSIALNYRRGALNFAYIHTHFDALNVAGAAIYWPESKLGNRAAAGAQGDTASPSSSWILPSGVSPDAAAGTVNMQIIDGWAPPNTRRGLWGMVITNAAGADPGGADAMAYGCAVAHEVGHMLNLGHRVEEITNAGLRARWNAGTLNPAAGGGIATLVQGSGNLGANDGLWCDELWHPRHQSVMNWAGSSFFAQDFDRLQARVVAQSPILDLAP